MRCYCRGEAGQWHNTREVILFLEVPLRSPLKIPMLRQAQHKFRVKPRSCSAGAFFRFKVYRKAPMRAGAALENEGRAVRSQAQPSFLRAGEGQLQKPLSGFLFALFQPGNFAVAQTGKPCNLLNRQPGFFHFSGSFTPFFFPSFFPSFLPDGIFAIALI